MGSESDCNIIYTYRRRCIKQYKQCFVTTKHKHCLEAVDRTLKDLRNNINLMGGLTVLLAGNFNQEELVKPMK